MGGTRPPGNSQEVNNLDIEYPSFQGQCLLLLQLELQKALQQERGS